MKYIIVGVAILTLSGCGWFERQVAMTTGYSKICVDGVQYLQFSSGATPQYTPDNRLVSCN
jgi:hypothetical protein